jgi:hypothetical protein
MRETIFETPPDTPSKSSDPNVLRSAMTPGECRTNIMASGAGPGIDRNVQNIMRPRRGYGY